MGGDSGRGRESIPGPPTFSAWPGGRTPDAARRRPPDLAPRGRRRRRSPNAWARPRTSAGVHGLRQHPAAPGGGGRPAAGGAGRRGGGCHRRGRREPCARFPGGPDLVPRTGHAGRRASAGALVRQVDRPRRLGHAGGGLWRHVHAHAALGAVAVHGAGCASGARRRRRRSWPCCGRAALVGLAGVGVGLWVGPALWNALGGALGDLPAWNPGILARYAVLLVFAAMAGAAPPAWRASGALPRGSSRGPDPGHPGGPRRPAGAVGPIRRRPAHRRRLRPRSLAPHHYPGHDSGRPRGLHRRGPRRPGGGDGPAVRHRPQGHRAGHRKHPVRQYHAVPPAGGDRLDLGGGTMAAFRGEPRGQVPDAAARVRTVGMPAGRIQDQRDQPPLADRARDPRGAGGRHPPPSHDQCRRLHARQRVFLHPRGQSWPGVRGRLEARLEGRQ